MTSDRPTAGPDDQPNSRRSRLHKAESRRRRVGALLGGGVAVAVGLALLLIALNRRGVDAPTVAAPETIKGPATEIASSIPRDGRTLGDPASPILVAEYADYQCPFCTGFGLTGLPKLLDDYVATGKVRLEYHHYIVIDGSDLNGESHRAAEAAECANDQGKFWEMHELLIANSLGEHQGSFTPERLKQIAARVDGLDQAAFGACVDARPHRLEVVRMVADGKAAGVHSTPTFVVNGEMVSGGYADLKAVIDAQLAGA